jgi:hypothetical protein
MSQVAFEQKHVRLAIQKHSFSHLRTVALHYIFGEHMQAKLIAIFFDIKHLMPTQPCNVVNLIESIHTQQISRYLDIKT